MDHNQDIYYNRAVLDPEATLARDVTELECCQEELVFALKDQQHAFSLGLSTVLRCLAIAEKEGYVPRLPDKWWVMLRQH